MKIIGAQVKSAINIGEKVEEKKRLIMKSLQEDIVHIHGNTIAQYLFRRDMFFNWINIRDMCRRGELRHARHSLCAVKKKDEISSSFEWDERKIVIKEAHTYWQPASIYWRGKKHGSLARGGCWMFFHTKKIINHHKRHFITWLFFNTSTCHAKSFPKCVCALEIIWQRQLWFLMVQKMIWADAYFLFGVKMLRVLKIRVNYH